VVISSQYVEPATSVPGWVIGKFKMTSAMPPATPSKRTFLELVNHTTNATTRRPMNPPREKEAMTLAIHTRERYKVEQLVFLFLS